MASKNNVVSRKTSTHIQWAFVLLLFFACQKYEAAEECDFTKCILNSRSFISDLRRENTPFHCRKFLNISGCSNYCMHKYYPSIFSHSNRNQHSIGEFCVQNIADRSNVSWSCIARRTLRLLTCLANISSLTSNNVHGDAIDKESCRKSLEFSDCPSKVLLSDCGEKSVEVVKDMIQFATDYFMPFSCKDINVQQIFEMPVHYYLGHEFMELASSFDRHLIGIDTCFQQAVQNEKDLHEFVCGGISLSNCIQFQASKDRKDFPPVRKLLLKLFSLGGIRCEHSQFAFKHLAPHTYQDSVTTKASPNEKIDEPTHSHLSDEMYSLSDSHEISVPQMTENKELFHHMNVTKPLVSQDVNKGSDSKYKFNHDEITNAFEEKSSEVKNAKDTSPFDFTKTHANDSIEKYHSENPSHKDIDYFKASSGANLSCDKTIYCIILLIILILKI